MLFNVEVVSAEDYDAYLQDLQDQGFESEAPVLGNGQAYSQAGVESEGLGEDDDEDGGNQ
jgi:cytochrome c oxidase subunit 2